MFAEPEGMHSWDPVWRYSYLTFFNSKFWCYRLITLLCAVPAAILWGKLIIGVIRNLFGGVSGGRELVWKREGGKPNVRGVVKSIHSGV